MIAAQIRRISPLSLVSAAPWMNRRWATWSVARESVTFVWP
ncbi:MAG: hypothetical protein ACREOS_03065 [Candidatus Dormibacteraceae bacterium]